MSVFDYVAFDSVSKELQAKFFEHASALEALFRSQRLVGIDRGNPDACRRSIDEGLKTLEVTYMWAGKVLRDAQLARGASVEVAPPVVSPPAVAQDAQQAVSFDKAKLMSTSLAELMTDVAAQAARQRSLIEDTNQAASPQKE